MLKIGDNNNMDVQLTDCSSNNAKRLKKSLKVRLHSGYTSLKAVRMFPDLFRTLPKTSEDYQSLPTIRRRSEDVLN